MNVRLPGFESFVLFQFDILSHTSGLQLSPPNKALGDIAIGAISLVAVGVTVAAAYVVIRLLQKPKVPLSSPSNQV
jgi:hypothetical protein